MAATITRNTPVRRTLLTPTTLAVNAAKSVTALVRSGTTATATATSHGFSVGDWVVVAGANHPYYNGPFQVVTAADANTFTYTMEGDPGGSASGVVTAQKGLAASIWGDGSTVNGNATVGAYSSAASGQLRARVATTTAPTTACRVHVFTSDTANPGTWREFTAADSTPAANDQSTHVVDVASFKFVLVVFWRVAGTAVVVDLIADETTYASNP